VRSIEQLREFQAEFELVRLADQSSYKERESLRRDFARRFPRDKILKLKPDEYVQGKGNKESFCYWIEWKLSELGHIQGTPVKKFGVFYSKKENSLQFTKEFKQRENPFDGVLTEIVSLLDAAEQNDLAKIQGAKISPMFKGKILFLYFPNKFLNIYSPRHIDHFLGQLRLNEPGTDVDLISKRELLVNFKNADEVMKDWSMFEFHDFLYKTWNSPPSQKNVTPLLKDYVFDFPAPEATEPEFISLKTGKPAEAAESESRKRSGTTDFERQNRRNKLAGNQGEDIVFLAEKKTLYANGKGNLAKDVKAVCKTDDGAGFDILSFELDGTPKQIEVKSTTSNPPSSNSSFRFFLSANEYEKSKILPNHYLYIVFAVKSKNPKIWRIKNPASLEPDYLALRPSAFVATLAVA
jgi:hypothetical protein